MGLVATTFLIVLTFSAPTAGSGRHVEVKKIRCSDMACVQMIEDRAHESTTLQRFEVYESGRDGIVEMSGASVFPPVIAWSPL